MKKILVVCTLCALTAACASQSASTNTTAEGKKVYYSAADAANDKNVKYQIIDQEFDNLLAPDSDYETLSDYELQACGSNYLPPAEKLKKPQAVVKKSAAKASKSTTTTSKKVVNTTNIYYLDEPASSATPTKKYASSTTTQTTSTTQSGSSFLDEDELEDDFDSDAF